MLSVLEGDGLTVEAEAGEHVLLGIFGGRDRIDCEEFPAVAFASVTVGLFDCQRSISKPKACNSEQKGLRFRASAITTFASVGEPSFHSAFANKNQPLIDVGCSCVTRSASAMQRCQSLRAA